ncbi:MAG: alpha/beta hydrolase [Aliidongia sp.]
MFSIICLLITLSLGIGSQLAAAEARAAAPDPYARPHQLVEIGAGRKLNLYCIGHGVPTVVFDADAGAPGWDWLLVQPAIAKRTQSCVYDRAGLGFSDPSNRPGTSANAVEDLNALLAAAGLKPPFILVGEGYGGMNVQLYAYRYPTDVIGLVLVDAQHEDEVARFDQLTDGKFSPLLLAVNIGFLKDCAAAAEAGFVPGSKIPADCVGSQLQDRQSFGPTLTETARHLFATAPHWAANFSEESNLPVSADQLRSARTSFGDRPVVYLTRGISPYRIPGQPQSETNKAVEQAVKAMHDEIAGLSAHGSNRVVRGAGHDIQLDRPKAVIDAVGLALKAQ